MIASAAPQDDRRGPVIASAAPSAVSWLYFANRLIELRSAWSASPWDSADPELTRDCAAATERDRARPNRARSSSRPARVAGHVGLIVLSGPIVRLLFEHGRVHGGRYGSTAQALVFLPLACRAGAGEGAVAGLFPRETRLHRCCDAEGGRGRDRVLRAARSFFWRGRCRSRYRARGLEQCAVPHPAGRIALRLFARSGRAAAAAAHRGGGAADGRGSVG